MGRTLLVRAVLVDSWTAIMSMILFLVGLPKRKLVGLRRQNLLRRQSPILFHLHPLE